MTNNVVAGRAHARKLTECTPKAALNHTNAIEFTRTLSGQSVLQIPLDVVAKLPRHGNARVIVLTEDDPEDADWRQAFYEQFFRDDAPDDTVYDSL